MTINTFDPPVITLPAAEQKANPKAAYFPDTKSRVEFLILNCKKTINA